MQAPLPPAPPGPGRHPAGTSTSPNPAPWSGPPQADAPTPSTQPPTRA